MGVWDRVMVSYHRSSPTTMLLLGILTTIVGLYITFLLGFHSFDMAQNIIFMRDSWHIETLEDGELWSHRFQETRINGQAVELEDVYIEGIGYLTKGFIITIFGILLTGYEMGRIQERWGRRK